MVLWLPPLEESLLNEKSSDHSDCYHQRCFSERLRGRLDRKGQREGPATGGRTCARACACLQIGTDYLREGGLLEAVPLQPIEQKPGVSPDLKIRYLVRT